MAFNEHLLMDDSRSSDSRLQLQKLETRLEFISSPCSAVFERFLVPLPIALSTDNGRSGPRNFGRNSSRLHSERREQLK